MVTKSIFFLATELVLTDIDRNTICSIKWSGTPVRQYFNTLNNANFSQTEIIPLNQHSAKEDIITFASVELYKRMKFDLLAVSYPGAQGDRCLLYGHSGRKTKRIYPDMIAYRESGENTDIFLEECKSNLSQSKNDVRKLKDFINDPDKLSKLHLLYAKICGKEAEFNLNIGLGAKYSNTCDAYDVDFIFMFSIDDHHQDKTLINYNVAIINLNLTEKLRPLANEAGRMIGTIEYEKIYTIK